MTDDIPEPERTVTVDTAHLLRTQIEHSQEQVKAGAEIDETYHEHRLQHTEQRIEELENTGLTESEVETRIEELKETIEETEPDTPQRLRAKAEFDADRQIHRRYFDGEQDSVEVEAINVTGFTDGSVRFRDMSGTAVLTFPEEKDARAAADAILDSKGIKDEAARVGMR